MSWRMVAFDVGARPERPTPPGEGWRRFEAGARLSRSLTSGQYHTTSRNRSQWVGRGLEFLPCEPLDLPNRRRSSRPLQSFSSAHSRVSTGQRAGSRVDRAGVFSAWILQWPYVPVPNCQRQREALKQAAQQREGSTDGWTVREWPRCASGGEGRWLERFGAKSTAPNANRHSIPRAC
jgi:hypothetical protein